MSDYRNVWALIVAVGLLQVAGGILGVITPLGLGALGVDAFSIGLIAALYAAGFMAGAWTAPRAISAVGNIRVFSAAAALTAAGTLLMGLEEYPVAWTVIRLVQGASFAWMFASAESWISAATPAPARGGVLGLYHVLAKAALLGGPFLIAGLSPLAPQPFLWAALFLAMALVPVCLTSRGEPSRPGRTAMTPMALIRLAPAAVWGVLLAGVINTGTLALLPVFAQKIAPDSLGGGVTQAAALAMAAAWMGGLVSQWPVGRISDRMDRRIVIACMGVVSGAAAIALGLMVESLPYPATLGLLALWGTGSLSFYGVAVAHGVDRTEPGQIAPMMSGLLFVWAFGSVLGPPLAGLAMRTPVGHGGLFIFAGGLTGLLVIAMLWRRTMRPAVAATARDSWTMTRPTSVSSSDIDPRSDPQ